MPTYEGYEIIDQTAFRVASVAPEYSILTADFGDGFRATANVGLVGGVKAFTAVAGLWSDDEFYGTIEGQAWMEYYWNFLHARLEAGNEPFVIAWRGKYWSVDLDEPRFALEALRSFNDDMFVPASLRLNTRRVSGIVYDSDGSLGDVPEPELPPIPTGLEVTDFSSSTISVTCDDMDAEAPAAPLSFTAVAQSGTTVLLAVLDEPPPDPPDAPASFTAVAQSDTEILLDVTD
jgi:hypothetical protein